MPLWNRLRQELDRASQAATVALDEGKLRLDAFRARQQADKAAQALGYALYRARQRSADLDADTYARLSSAIAAHEATVSQLEVQLADAVAKRRGSRPSAATDTADERQSPQG
jgi:uncharacterized coiled-coil protein SlyX